VGPAVASWANSLRVSSLFEPTRRLELPSAFGLFAFRTLRSYERFTSGWTLRHRNARDPLDAVRSLSRIRRLSPPGGPSRTGSFR
jgi:hypothetical protein